jgi:hypothetical protein
MHPLVLDPDCLKPGMQFQDWQTGIVIPLAKSATAMSITGDIALVGDQMADQRGINRLGPLFMIIDSLL